MTRIGLISDTHGLMRPEALLALQGVEHIVHAGDIGSANVLEQLERIAPTTAVRGNNDREAWAKKIPEHDVLEVENLSIYLLHDLKALDLDPAEAGFAAVIAGHSHKPAVTEKNGVLYINPGSAGPRRFKLPITVGLLEIEGREIQATIHQLS